MKLTVPRVLLLAVSLSPAAAASATEATPAWTETQLEQRAVEELIRDGVSLSRLGLLLRVRRDGGRWAVLLEEPSSGEARARILERLPPETEAAVAEVAAVATALVERHGAERAQGLPGPKLEPRLEKKVKLTEILAERQGPYGAAQAKAVSLGVSAASVLTTPITLIFPMMMTSNSPSARNLGITGASVTVAGALVGPFLDDRNPLQIELPVSLGLVGLGMGALAAGYSPGDVYTLDGTDTVVMPRGYRPAFLITGSALALSGGLLLLSGINRPACTAAEQLRHFDSVRLAAPGERAERVSALEQCAVRAQARGRTWWMPASALIAGAAGLAGYWLLAPNPEPVSTLMSGLTLLMGPTLLSAAFLDGPAEDFVARIELEKLPLEVAVAPAPTGLVIHGRF
ncbi:MAG: hypothetical protein HYZ28_13760 [Myxococcales bacterium]|nr:hypothetical protein [Myxococcales bacterium]